MRQTVKAIILKNNRVLLVKQGAGELCAGFWCLPGGRMEKGETQIQTLKREVKEETNFTLTCAKYAFSVKGHSLQPRLRQHFYFAKAKGKIKPEGIAVADVKYFLLNRLPKNMAFNHRAIIRQALKQKP